MRRRSGCVGWVSLAAGLVCTAAAGESFFATEVVTYSPGPGVTAGQGFGVSARVLGGPQGAGNTIGSLDVLTLGVGGSVTVGFAAAGRERRIVDGPGADFIVSENSFYIGGNTNNCFAELAFVEVSSDGVNFVRIPSSSLTAAPVAAFGGINPANVAGLAGARPVIANVLTNASTSCTSDCVDPFDPARAGGDAFDLAALAGDPLVASGVVRLNAIRFVRIVDVPGDGGQRDSAGRPIYDATGFNNACDIDAVSVIHGCTLGDADGDGLVTAADVAALVEEALRLTGARPCLDINADGRVDGEDAAAMTGLVVNP